MRRLSTAVGVLVLLVVCGALAKSVRADTVYLKNGRVIHSSIVRVEDDRVVVKQYEGLVAFPRELVDHVEENDRVEPGGFVPPQPEAPFEEEQAGTSAEGDQADEGATPEEGAAPDEGAAQSDEGQAGDEEAAQADAPEDPRRDEAYWQSRLQPIFSQMDRAEGERREYETLAQTSAEAQRQLDRIDRQLADLERQAEAIRSEARSLGVPPGWLRR
jgi:hypothetical protein